MGNALITGASKGIGKAIAEELASRGFDLLLVARSENLLQQVANEITSRYKVKADYFAIDLSTPNAAQKVLDWCNEKKYPITALVNNAGYGLSGPMEKFAVEENSNMMQLNMIALMQMCQLFLPILKLQTRAYIMNIASSAAYQAIPNLSIYSATKSFVLSFSRGLKQELAKTSVTVTTISPGATDTDFVVRAKVGEKGLKAANKLNMTPQAVAKIAVKSMLAGKTEVITGFVNKLGAAMAWLLPKSLVETTTMKIYE